MTTGEGFRVDLHVKVLDERVVERAKQRGLDAVVYAPHFTRLPDIRCRAERFSDDELVVIPGRELFTGHWQRRRHVLGVGLDEPIPDFITLEAALEELERQGAAVLVPHPGFLTISLSAEEIAAFRDSIDAVEVYNPKFLPHHHRRARHIAVETGLPGFASSYAHLRGTIGEAWTVFEGPVRDAAGLAEAIRGGSFRIEHRSGNGHRLRRVAELAHVGWENSWEKFDRVFLSGTEPTHPGHVAYDGRFEDVRVY